MSYVPDERATGEEVNELRRVYYSIRRLKITISYPDDQSWRLSEKSRQLLRRFCFSVDGGNISISITAELPLIDSLSEALLLHELKDSLRDDNIPVALSAETS